MPPIKPLTRRQSAKNRRQLDPIEVVDQTQGLSDLQKVAANYTFPNASLSSESGVLGEFAKLGFKDEAARQLLEAWTKAKEPHKGPVTNVDISPSRTRSQRGRLTLSPGHVETTVSSSNPMETGETGENLCNLNDTKIVTHSTQRWPPRFAMTQVFSGGMAEDVRSFVRMFRLRATNSKLTEKEKGRELQCLLQAAALRWFDANYRDFNSADRLLECMVNHFTNDAGRLAVRRRKLETLKQDSGESLGDYDARFMEGKVDTYLRDEEYKRFYIQGLRPSLMSAVIGQPSDSLLECMAVAGKIYAQMCLIPDLVNITKHVEIPVGNKSKKEEKRKEGDYAELVATIERIEPKLNALTGASSNQQSTYAAPPQKTLTHDNVTHTCSKCGKQGHHTNVCGIRCHNCNRMGHKAHNCRNPQQAQRPAPYHTRSQGGDSSALQRGKLECTHCMKTGHTKDRCFKNPDSASYRPPNKGKGNDEKTPGSGN